MRAEDGSAIQIEASEHPSSPAFSTSSTAEGGSSPILPPLPAPTFHGRTLDILKTPPSGSRTDSTQYYTASWGSPYQQPAASSTGTRSHAYSHTLSSEPSEDSPIRHLEFHTPFLRPPPTFTRPQTDPEFVSQDGLVSAAVLANRARRPAQGLTEDWIRQHTGGESTERTNWLSDDPGDSEHSSLSGSISGDGGDWLGQEADPRTPTLKRFLESREKTRATNRGPKRQPSTDTLKQADFSDSKERLKFPIMSASGGIDTGAEMGNQASSPADERPPLPPPKELSTWHAAAIPAPSPDTLPAPAPTVSPTPAPPRLKKKVPWKGKNIMVLLPWDDERGQKGKAPTPMTEKDVEATLKEWEQLGYDTTGFNLGQPIGDNEEGAQGQSRNIWPHVEDVLHERDNRAFRVSIPDRRGKSFFSSFGASSCVAWAFLACPISFINIPSFRAIDTSHSYIDDVMP